MGTTLARIAATMTDATTPPSPHAATPSSRTDRLVRRMIARDRGETHRASTPLELLVDLSFVVAVAQIASELHHSISEGHVADALPGYLMVFFAIWWAWMNFTWFASAFDVDDVPYRLLTFLQIAGVLVLAAGVPKAFEQNDFLAITIGYVIMRLAMVAQWLRAARSVPDERGVALRYAIGVSIVQIAEPWRGVGQTSKNAVVVAPGRLDRSATGTGLSARMAVLHARGLMKAGDAMTHASAIGSTFDGRIVSETTVGGGPAIVPAIRGSAWITGISQLVVDPTDPFPEGYLLSDTWGVSGADAQA